MSDTQAILDRFRAKKESEETGSHASRLNWLRAGVLGANDGITSVAGLVIGVAAADPTNVGAIAIAGVSGLLAGASSMSVGEFVSVSTQSDAERALIARKRADLETDPGGQFEKLVAVYRDKGVSDQTARHLVQELYSHDKLDAHVDAELQLDEDDIVSPTAAAISSFIAFTLGALLPLAAVLLPGPSLRIPVAFVAVVLALMLTGFVSAKLGRATPWKAVIRMVIGGALAMGLTYLIGQLLGAQVA